MGKQWKQWQTLFPWAPKSLQTVTAVVKLKGACSLKKKSYNKPRESIKKQRHYFAYKIRLVKAMFFLVVTYGCDSWTIKKAEQQRIDAFELWCWRRLLRVPWTARRLNQSVLKEINPNIHWKNWCWSWSSNILATWCKELTHWKRPWCWKKNGRQKEKGTTEDEIVGWHHRFDGREFEQALGVGDGQGSLACCSPQGRKVRQDWVTELNWTE